MTNDGMDEFERFKLMVESGRVTMDFGGFHELSEKLMGCPIWIHEFASEEMQLEMKIRLLTGIKTVRTKHPVETLMELVPKEKIIIV